MRRGDPNRALANLIDALLLFGRLRIGAARVLQEA